MINEDSAQRIIEGLEEAVEIASGRANAAKISIYDDSQRVIYSFDPSVSIADDEEWWLAIKAITLITHSPSRSMAPIMALLNSRTEDYAASHPEKRINP